MILPLDISTSKESNTNQLPVKVVTPAEQTVEHVTSELQREDINPSSVVGMFHKPKRRRRVWSSQRKCVRKSKGGKKTNGVEKEAGRAEEERLLSNKDIFNV